MGKKTDLQGKTEQLENVANKNVIVVMLDSLQFNYLGCYGNTWIKTPNIDRLAREGVLFENNYIESLPTIPCRRSMFTGRYSLHYRGWSPLELEETTIADLCWGHPIDSALIYDSAPMRLPKFGYSRGFDKVWFIHGQELDESFYANDTLYDHNPRHYIEDHVLESTSNMMGPQFSALVLEEIDLYLRHRQYWKSEEDQNVARVMKHAVRYLEEHDRNKQFFLWIDSFDPHEPWDPPSVYDPDLKCPYDPDYKGKDMFLPVMNAVEGIFTEPEMHHVRMLYAEKVTLCDKWVGYLLNKVRELGLEQNTLLMLLSDHGEPMGNGEHGHGIMRKCRPWPYEELAHAPMIVRGPGLPAGKRIKTFTQSCDVAPTLTDWLGIGVRPEMTGQSLLPLLRGETDKIRDFAICGYHKYSLSIHTDDWSFIHWRKPTDKAEGAGGIEFYVRDATREMRSVGAFERKQGVVAAFSMLENALPDATLDGEDMWTCTPGSVAAVPENDELYDRQADPFQLHNIIDKDPKKAEELYNALREFLAELQTQ